MQLFSRSVGGTVLTVLIDCNRDVLHLKQELERFSGVLVADQRILFGGRELAIAEKNRILKVLVACLDV